MRKPGYILYFLMILFHSACAQDSTINEYSLGSLKIKVQTVCFNQCDTNITFINVHENEATSVEAAKQFLKDHGGNLITLKHSGNRNLSFSLKNKVFSVDPNRMYTDSGRKASMKALGDYKHYAAVPVKRFAEQLLTNFIDGKSLVVALHNNTDSAYSILSYINKELEGNNAADVYINDTMDTDDFILTTDNRIFDSLKVRGINVILQSKNALDDGSLSVYAEKNNISYINVEAEHGHVEEQLRMLQALKDVLIFYRSNDTTNRINFRK